MDKVVLIPALEPDEKLIKLADELAERGFDRIIVVDDGSGEDAQRIFGQLVGCTVIRHDQNMGKGEALKTGMAAATDLYGRSIGIITADADGQHRPGDIVKVAEAMDKHPQDLILGVRDFSREDVPARSRIGNRITAFFFRLTTGVRCSDTQTGLRGVPAGLLGLALRESGARYEYEMNFLQDAAAAANITEVPVATVYENNNKCSHFRPVRDSARVYGRLLRFLASSALGACTDFLLFLFLLAAFPGAVLLATVIARVCSGGVNFLLNKYWCFESRQRSSSEAARYAALFIALMLTSAGCVSLLSGVIPAAAAKFLTDSILFIASYAIQRRWVFRNRKDVTPMKTGKKIRWAAVYGTALVIYTAFTLIYTFVIPQNVIAIDDMETQQVSQVSEEPYTANGSGTQEPSTESVTAEPVVTSNSYQGNGISITLTQQRVADTDVYIADVVLSDGVSLQSGLANNSFGRNVSQTTSEIASDNGAVLAINGDYYGFRDTGYVLRNGYLYRDTASGGEDLVVYEDGSMEIINENDVTAQELIDRGAVQIYSFGPGLVIDGEVAVSYGEEVSQSMRSNPRTAIGMISENHYVFVVSDGRTEESAGLDLYDLAVIMQDLGCETAYNLDGGGSSTMWFNGEVVNNPTGGRAGHGNSERSVSDIIYVG